MRNMSGQRSGINMDDLLLLLAEGYVIAPVVIYCIGLLRWLYAIVGTALLLALGILLFLEMRSRAGEEIRLITRVNLRFWLVVVAVVFAWIWFSGIGSTSYQNDDYFVRNPIYSDLVNYSWPVTYDLSQEPDLVREICGEGRVAFSYYYCWWLPAAALCKAFGFTGGVRTQSSTYGRCWAFC